MSNNKPTKDSSKNNINSNAIYDSYRISLKTGHRGKNRIEDIVKEETDAEFIREQNIENGRVPYGENDFKLLLFYLILDY